MKDIQLVIIYGIIAYKYQKIGKIINIKRQIYFVLINQGQC